MAKLVLSDVLRELFCSHGVEATSDGDWVMFANSTQRLTAAVVKPTSHPAKLSVQLDVRLELSSGRTVVESFAGIGADYDEAVADAVEGFVRATFHVLLSAFFDRPDDGQVHREEWLIGQRRARVTLGNFVTRGKNDAGPELANCFKQIEARLKTSTLQQGIHWIRIFYAQMEREPLAFEVLLDNDTWEPMEAELANVMWPTRDEYFSARLFLVVDVLPEPASPSSMRTRPWWKLVGK